MNKRTYTKDFKLYRAKKDGSGCAISFSFDPKNECVWLAGAKQAGDVFLWKNNIVMKLGLADIGELISVLERRKPFAGQENSKYKSLFHQADSHTSSLKFESNSNMSISVQMRVNKGEDNNIQHSLIMTQGESSVLLVLLKDVISKIFDW